MYGQTALSTLFNSGKPVSKEQTFTSSGTFTPSAALLAQGGWVQITVIGGGSAGCGGYTNGASNNIAGDGGNAGQVKIKRVQISAAVTITIGAAGTTDSAQGGTTSFGAYLTANGGTYPTYAYAQGYGNPFARGGNGSGGSGSNPVMLAGGSFSLGYSGAGGACTLGFAGGGGTSGASADGLSAVAGASACPGAYGSGGAGGMAAAGFTAGTAGAVIVDWSE
jgi:hypothetical protein